MAPKEPMLARPAASASNTPADAATATNAASNKSAADPAAAYIGQIRELRADDSLTVIYPGITTALPARLAAVATRDRIETAILLQQSVVLLFEQGDLQRPIVIGFLNGLVETPGHVNEAHAVDAKVIEADVDGKRVRVIGQDEIVLECGQASITLRRNGRVVIRGTHVETQSEGTNRIKGGQVRIN